MSYRTESYRDEMETFLLGRNVKREDLNQRRSTQNRPVAVALSDWAVRRTLNIVYGLLKHRLI